MGLQPARVKNMLATETTQHFHSHKKRKEKEGGEKVGNLRSDRQPSTSYMKGPNEIRSPEVGIRKLQFLSAKSLTRIGAWNVRTFYVMGRLVQVLREMRSYNLQIHGSKRDEMDWKWKDGIRRCYDTLLGRTVA